MRKIVTIALALTALSFATPAEAKEAFTVNVSRTAADTYQVNKTSIAVQTQGCVAPARNTTAVMVINDAAGSGKIHFMNMSGQHEVSCKISYIWMQKLGASKASKVPVKVTGRPVNLLPAPADIFTTTSRDAAFAAADVMRALRNI